MFIKHMKSAVEVARRGNSIYGAVIAMGDQQLVATTDAADQDYDPIGHAVLVALRELGLMTQQRAFPGYALYTTVEPCPMCTSACVMTGMGELYYGLQRSEVKQKRYPGEMRAKDVLAGAEQPPVLNGGVGVDYCRSLLDLGK